MFLDNKFQGKKKEDTLYSCMLINSDGITLKLFIKCHVNVFAKPYV